VRGSRVALVLSFSLTASLSSAVAGARTEVEFAYGGGKYVKPREAARAGLVVVPDAVSVGARAPLVVFLHGLNQDGPLHKWMGAKGNPDVSAMLASLQAEGKAAPFLVAAPSQTIDASKPWGMWAGFDLADFVQKTEAALGSRAVVDRSRVVVLAHSGGGCNVHGSALLAASAKAPAPYAVVLADTCFDRGVAETLLKAAPSTRVHTFYQTASWERDFEPFRSLFLGSREHGPHERSMTHVPLTGYGSHDRILSIVVERAIPVLLPKTLAPEPSRPVAGPPSAP
jgi:poly(3-hydroxybutyrate) depolymerase